MRSLHTVRPPLAYRRAVAALQNVPRKHLDAVFASFRTHGRLRALGCVKCVGAKEDQFEPGKPSTGLRREHVNRSCSERLSGGRSEKNYARSLDSQRPHANHNQFSLTKDYRRERMLQRLSEHVSS